MPVPTVAPQERTQVARADSYRRGDRVWVYRHDGWHPALVDDPSPLAVLVTYRPCGSGCHLVDTVVAEYVMARDEFDPQLDLAGGGLMRPRTPTAPRLRCLHPTLAGSPRWRGVWRLRRAVAAAGPAAAGATAPLPVVVS